MARGHRALGTGVLGGLAIATAGPAAAFTLAFSNADSAVTPSFSDVHVFSFTIDVSGPLAPGS